MTILSKIKYYINKPQIDYSAFYKENNTDYEIVGDTTDILDKIPLARNRFNGIQYNQLDVSPVSCTVHGAATALSALTGITFTTEQRKAIWEQMKADGTGREAWGGYVESAVKKWADWWNTSFPDNQVEYARVIMGSTQMYTLLSKGYVIDMSYRWTNGYNEDWIYDSIVNQQWDNDQEKEEYGALSDGGHCLALMESDIYKIKTYNILNIDNYISSPSRIKNNIYAIDKNVIPRLVDNNRRIWNQYGYVFYFKQDFEDANIEVDRKLLARLENRVVYNPDKDKFAIIKNGKAIELKGKHMSELFKYKWSNTNESYCLGLDKTNWLKIGLK